MLVDSHRGHLSEASGIGMLARRARSAIEPGMIEFPGPRACSAVGGAGGGSKGLLLLKPVFPSWGLGNCRGG